MFNIFKITDMSSSTPAAANEQKPLRLPLNQQNDFFNDYFQK